MANDKKDPNEAEMAALALALMRVVMSARSSAQSEPEVEDPRPKFGFIVNFNGDENGHRAFYAASPMLKKFAEPLVPNENLFMCKTEAEPFGKITSMAFPLNKLNELVELIEKYNTIVRNEERLYISRARITALALETGTILTIDPKAIFENLNISPYDTYRFQFVGTKDINTVVVDGCACCNTTPDASHAH